MASLFELETGIDYSNFSNLSSRMEALKNTVASWKMVNESPGSIDKDLGDGCNVQESEGWTLEMESEKKTVVDDLETCIQRINNITKAIECVIRNHQGLQNSLKFQAPGVRRYNEDGSLNGLNCDASFYNNIGDVTTSESSSTVGVDSVVN